MKILRVSSDLYPDFIGGLALHVHELSVIQSKLECDVTVYTYKWNNEPSHEYTSDYEIKRFGGVALLRNAISLSLLRAIILNSDKYDLVHAHGQAYCTTLFCSIAKKIKKFPFVITIHGVGGQASTIPSWVQKIYVATFMKFVLKSADCLLVYTNEEKKLVIDYGIDPSKIVIIHNGICVDRFLKCPAVTKKKQILWIGKYIPIKGVDYLIDGFAKFSENHPEYSLLMVGRGQYKNIICNKIKELSLSDKVTMIDFIPNAEIATTYKESMVFILPSLGEGVPKSLMEAMVCGLPVIMTDLPQLTSLVKGCGISIPIQDSEAITSALETLVANPDLIREYGKNGVDKIIHNYDWKDTVQKTTELFYDIAKK